MGMLGKTQSEPMTAEALFSLALETFAQSWATFGIPDKVKAPGYDRAFGERVCSLVFDKCGRDPAAYDRALHDFMLLSEEFVKLQMELDRAGHYRHASFDEVRRAVYDNPEYMDSVYLNGLLLSQAFWINHTKMYAYFAERFCRDNPAAGTVLEVPSGTGFFIAEFARLNPGWTATGIDLSESSVAFGSAVARLGGAPNVRISRQDVFALTDDAGYDRIICGELLEHLEDPEALLEKLTKLIAPGGRLYVTTAIWAAALDHIYLYESARDVREMLERYFVIDSELALNLKDDKGPEDAKTPINYACVLLPKG
jgi:2-polyprenyl-3-methyl-5-hydroxy-6-metoxy-1,4-benzoquinol methylase